MLRPAAEQRRDYTIMALVGLGLLAFYLAIQRGEWVSYDGRQMASLARNIWQHGRLQVFGNSFGGAFSSHQKVSPFGIGASLLYAPMWALQLKRDPNGAFWLTTVNPVLTAVTGMLL